MKNEPELHLNNFNGPLELLLYLIKKDQMNLYDIQISEITHQYIRDLKQMSSLKINVVGSFLVMASRLMYLKSKLLLPKPITHDDSDSDPRSKLVHQLVIYRKYKQASRNLKRLAFQRQKMFTRPAVIPSHSNHLINLKNQLDVKILSRVFRGMIEKRVMRRPISENIPKWRYSVQHQSKWILKQLHWQSELSLNRLLTSDNLEAIITNFLAILGLIKERLISLSGNRNQFLLKLGHESR